MRGNVLLNLFIIFAFRSQYVEHTSILCYLNNNLFVFFFKFSVTLSTLIFSRVLPSRKNISKPLFIDIAGLFTKSIVQTYLLKISINHNDILCELLFTSKLICDPTMFRQTVFHLYTMVYFFHF